MAEKGLGALRKREAEKQAERDEARAKFDIYFKLSFEKDAKIGDTLKARIRPLNELDEDAKNFSADAGVAIFDKQWSNPSREKWFMTISDTMATEGRCVGQEKSNEPTGGTYVTKAGVTKPETGWNKGWKPKEFVYVNVLVDLLDGSEPQVKVAKFNMNPKAVEANTLIDCHDNNGSITDRWFSITKTKDGPESVNVAVKMSPLDKDDSLPPVSEYELFDLEPLLPTVPYAKQREALGLLDEVQEAAAQPAGQTAPATAGATQSVSW